MDGKPRAVQDGEDLRSWRDAIRKRGNELQDGHERNDEDAHRALVARRLRVQIGERRQPDEDRHRAGRPNQRQVPRLGRLHADDERVDQAGGDEQD